MPARPGRGLGHLLSWVKKQGPLAHLPGGPLLEMEWAALMPDAVLTGLPSWVQRSHSWAGLALGWVHKSVSLLSGHPLWSRTNPDHDFQTKCETPGDDVMAQALCAGMLNLL